MSQITSKLTQKTTRLVQQQQMNKIFNKKSVQKQKIKISNNLDS